MPAPHMVESEEEESKWDWWPEPSSTGVLVTVPEARKTGIMLKMRANKYLETGAPSLKKRDYVGVQENRTLRDYSILPGRICVATARGHAGP
eukprot:5314813-Amphidinium_carterae.2